MKSKSPTSKTASKTKKKELVTGQVWRTQDSILQIQLVGARLVHYKLFKGDTKRAPVSLTGKAALEKYLRTNNGVLVPAAKQ